MGHVGDGGADLLFRGGVKVAAGIPEYTKTKTKTKVKTNFLVGKRKIGGPGERRGRKSQFSTEILLKTLLKSTKLCG